MAININELSLTVKGNVVKNNDEGKDTVLRMTEDQAREIYDDLTEYFKRNPSAQTPQSQFGSLAGDRVVDSDAKTGQPV